LANKNSRKPSLFAETKDPSQKKTGVLTGIETGVGNRNSNTSKILFLLAIIPIMVWLSYVAISKVTAPNSSTGNLLTTNNKAIDQKNPTKAIEDPSHITNPITTLNETELYKTEQNEGSAKIIDEASPIEMAQNDEDMVSSAFDSLEKSPTEENPAPPEKATKPKSKTKVKKTSRKTTSSKQSAKSTAEAGDVAVLQALLAYKKVPSKPQAITSETKPAAAKPKTTTSEHKEVNEAVKEKPAPQQLALAVPTSSGIKPTPQQALLSNGLNNTELAATAGTDKDPTLLSSTKALIKKCDEMEELDAAICKWDVCDQYGGDESMCSKAFTKKKEKTGFKFLKYLGLD
jgi:hypothetical protein